ncbi:MAG: adenine deaminase [Dehalococcoidales bacterium]|jgi:adenine deaminase
MLKDKQQLISAAKGDAPADLILKNGRVVNVFSGEIEKADVAIYGGRVAGVGDYASAKEIIDLKGKWVAPGLINGHVHLESSMLDAGQYARAVAPHGTAAIVTDLHEIANVCGIAGIEYIVKAARRLPLDLFLMAPSCVPATHLETSGAVISAADIKKLLRLRECIGLGEVMNYPGVLAGDAAMLDKIAAAGGKAVDGHAPGLGGQDLNAYIGAGIGSDHESVTLAEADEKLRRGMFLMIREGSTEKNLEELLPLVTARTYPRCCLVTDDRHAADILRDGDIDAVVRKAIRLGLEPVRAVQMATINPAGYFRLKGLGAIAPGFYADLLILDSLEDFQIGAVYYRGRKVAQDGQPLFSIKTRDSGALSQTVNVKSFTPDALKLKVGGGEAYVIEIVPGQIITRKRHLKVKVKDGLAVPDTESDILKAAVVERHKATGNIGVGLVKGFGLQRGALASSVAHDSHNIVAVGVSDGDIYAAVKEVIRRHGGVAAAAGGKVLGSLALPIAGLLSPQPLEDVVKGLEKLEKIAKDLGCVLPSPLAALSFLALPVIPELRLTDLGLVDVNAFKLIE